MSALAKRTALVAFVLAGVLAANLWVHSAMAARLAAAAHLRVPDEIGILFWDAGVYVRGILKLAAGHTPYDDPIDSWLPFAYPPIFARAGVVLATIFPSPWGYRTYIALYLISLAGSQLLIAPLFLRRVGRAGVVTMLLLAPLSLITATAFWSGNIHLIWLFLALVAALPGLWRERWMAYRVVALLAMVNQPVFAALLLLPVFAGRRQWLPGIATGMIGVAVYAGQMVFDRTLYLDFQRNVAVHLASRQDYGQGVFGIIMWFLKRAGHPIVPLAAACQIAFSLAVVGCLFALRGRIDRRDPRWWGLLALAIVIVNPRVMPYDAIVVIAPAIAFLIALSSLRQWGIAVVITLLSLAFHKAFGLTLPLIAGFVAGAWQMWRAPARQDQLASA